MKKKTTMLSTGRALLALSFILYSSLAAESQGGINLALNKTVAASSIETADYPASNAVDGNTSTKWSSSGTNYNQWLSVQLGRDYSITSVVIKWADTYYSSTYDIQVSYDNTVWTTIKTVSNFTPRTGDTLTGLSGKGKYVRFNGRGRSGGTEGARYRIAELELYGIEVVTSTTNLALNRMATASSVESAAYPATNAVDGNMLTKWSSSGTNYMQWLSVDLGQAYNIDKVVIKWIDTYFSSSYDIQISDNNTNWSTLKSTSNATPRTVDSINGLQGKGRYIRFNGRGRGGGTSGARYRIAEFEVYGKSNDTLTAQQRIQLDTITQRLKRRYIPRTVNESSVTHYLNTQQANGSWSDVNYDTVVLNFAAAPHLNRLLQMAFAWGSPGNMYYHSPLLADRILLGLKFFKIKDPKSTNWFYNDIGAPEDYMVPLIILKGTIPDDTLAIYSSYLRDQVARFDGDAKNLSWIANISMHKGCIENDYVMVDRSFKAIYSTLQIVSGQDDEGIKIDYSFHQHHAQLYSGGYGLSLLSDIANTIELAEGTDFINSISSGNRTNLSNFVLKGTQLFGYRHTMDFGSAGRNIARQTTSTYANMPASFLEKMIAIDSTNKQDYINLSTHLSGAPFPASYQGNKYFWKSDIMTHHGANYYLSAKIISKRTYGTESLNGENTKAYNLPLGATNILTNGYEYSLVYPVWDWTRIPGTTALHNQDSTALSSYQIGTNAFGGGVSNGQNGLIAFEGDYRQVKAKKAYFFMDDAMVCLGSGINSAQAFPVYTSVNQAFLSGDVYFNTNNGKKGDLFQSSSQTFPDLKWAHHGNVGYIFAVKPKADATITLQKAVQKGTWRSININGTKDTVSRNIFSLWFDHGNTPVNATYQYIVVPDKTLTDFQNYVKHNRFVIVSNDTAKQAVRNDDTRQYGAVFYRPDSLEFGGKDSINISVDKSVLVFISRHDSIYRISVADPLYKESDIIIKVNKKLIGTGALTGDTTIIHFSMPKGDLTGSSVVRDYVEAIPGDSVQTNASPVAAINSAADREVMSNNEPSMQLHPNPVHSTLTIRHGANIYSSLTIYSSSGIVVLQNSISKNTSRTSADVSVLPPGTYIVTLEGTGRKVSGKFIKIGTAQTGKY